MIKNIIITLLVITTILNGVLLKMTLSRVEAVIEINNIKTQFDTDFVNSTQDNIEKLWVVQQGIAEVSVNALLKSDINHNLIKELSDIMLKFFDEVEKGLGHDINNL